MPDLPGNFLRGKYKLPSYLAIGFFLISLLTITVTVSDPLRKQLINTFAVVDPGNTLTTTYITPKPTPTRTPTPAPTCVPNGGIVANGLHCCSGLVQTSCTGSGSFVNCKCTVQVVPTPTPVYRTCVVKTCLSTTCISTTYNNIPFGDACQPSNCIDNTSCAGNIVTCGGKTVGTKECNASGGYNMCQSDGKWYSFSCPTNTTCSGGVCKPNPTPSCIRTCPDECVPDLNGGHCVIRTQAPIPTPTNCGGKAVGTKECNTSGGYNYCQSDGKWYSSSCPANTTCSGGTCVTPKPIVTPTPTPSTCSALISLGCFVTFRTCIASPTGGYCSSSAATPTPTPTPRITPRPTPSPTPTPNLIGGGIPKVNPALIPVVSPVSTPISTSGNNTSPQASPVSNLATNFCQTGCSQSEILLNGQTAGRIGYQYSNGDIAGFYIAPNGKYYPIAQSAGGPTASDLSFLALKIASTTPSATNPDTANKLTPLTNADCGQFLVAVGTACQNPVSGKVVDYNYIVYSNILTSNQYARGTSITNIPNPSQEIIGAAKVCKASGRTCSTYGDLIDFALTQLKSQTQDPYLVVQVQNANYTKAIKGDPLALALLDQINPTLHSQAVIAMNTETVSPIGVPPTSGSTNIGQSTTIGSSSKNQQKATPTLFENINSWLVNTINTILPADRLAGLGSPSSLSETGVVPVPVSAVTSGQGFIDYESAVLKGGASGAAVAAVIVAPHALPLFAEAITNTTTISLLSSPVVTVGSTLLSAGYVGTTLVGAWSCGSDSLSSRRLEPGFTTSEYCQAAGQNFGAGMLLDPAGTTQLFSDVFNKVFGTVQTGAFLVKNLRPIQNVVEEAPALNARQTIDLVWDDATQTFVMAGYSAPVTQTTVVSVPQVFTTSEYTVAPTILGSTPLLNSTQNAIIPLGAANVAAAFTPTLDTGVVLSGANAVLTQAPQTPLQNTWNLIKTLGSKLASIPETGGGIKIEVPPLNNSGPQYISNVRVEENAFLPPGQRISVTIDLPQGTETYSPATMNDAQKLISSKIGQEVVIDPKTLGVIPANTITTTPSAPPGIVQRVADWFQIGPAPTFEQPTWEQAVQTVKDRLAQPQQEVPTISYTPVKVEPAVPAKPGEIPLNTTIYTIPSQPGVTIKVNPATKTVSVVKTNPVDLIVGGNSIPPSTDVVLTPFEEIRINGTTYSVTGVNPALDPPIQLSQVTTNGVTQPTSQTRSITQILPNHIPPSLGTSVQTAAGNLVTFVKNIVQITPSSGITGPATSKITIKPIPAGQPISSADEIIISQRKSSDLTSSKPANDITIQWNGQQRLTLTAITDQNVYTPPQITDFNDKLGLTGLIDVNSQSYGPSDTIYLRRTIRVTPEQAVQIAKGKLAYSAGVSKANGNLSTAINTYIAENGPVSLPDIIKLTLSKAGDSGLGISTAFDTVHNPTAITPGNVLVEYFIEIPANKIVVLPEDANGDLSLPNGFNLNWTGDLASYGYVAQESHINESEITFLFQIPPEYIKDIQIYNTQQQAIGSGIINLGNTSISPTLVKYSDIVKNYVARLSEPEAVLLKDNSVTLSRIPLDKLRKLSDKTGSIDGGIYELIYGNSSDSVIKPGKYYVKFYSNPDQSKTEWIADTFYRLLGVDTPIPQLVVDDSGQVVAIATEFRNGLIEKPLTDLSAQSAANKAYIPTALLANWDGLSIGNANVLFDPIDGHAVMIDNGGSLYFRALGGPKSFPADSVGETASLLDPKINYESARLLSGLTNTEIKAQAAILAARLNDPIIDSVISHSGISNGAELAKALKGRRDVIINEFLGLTIPNQSQNRLQASGNAIRNVLVNVVQTIVPRLVTGAGISIRNAVSDLGQSIRNIVSGNTISKTDVSNSPIVEVAPNLPLVTERTTSLTKTVEELNLTKFGETDEVTVYHGSEKPITVRLDFPGDPDSPGSLTLGNGLYATFKELIAQDYAQLRGKGIGGVVNVLKIRNANILDLRSDPSSLEAGNKPVSQEFAADWYIYINKIKDLRIPRGTSLLDEASQGLWNNYLSHLNKILESGKPVDLRVLLQTSGIGAHGSPPWVDDFREFMLSKDIDGVIYIESGDLVGNPKNDATLVIYNYSKIGTPSDWIQRDSGTTPVTGQVPEIDTTNNTEPISITPIKPAPTTWFDKNIINGTVGNLLFGKAVPASFDTLPSRTYSFKDITVLNKPLTENGLTVTRNDITPKPTDSYWNKFEQFGYSSYSVNGPLTHEQVVAKIQNPNTRIIIIDTGLVSSTDELMHAGSSFVHSLFTASPDPENLLVLGVSEPGFDKSALYPYLTNTQNLSDDASIQFATEYSKLLGGLPKDRTVWIGHSMAGERAILLNMFDNVIAVSPALNPNRDIAMTILIGLNNVGSFLTIKTPFMKPVVDGITYVLTRITLGDARGLALPAQVMTHIREYLHNPLSTKILGKQLILPNVDLPVGTYLPKNMIFFVGPRDLLTNANTTKAWLTRFLTSHKIPLSALNQMLISLPGAGHVSIFTDPEAAKPVADKAISLIYPGSKPQNPTISKPVESEKIPTKPISVLQSVAAAFTGASKSIGKNVAALYSVSRSFVSDIITTLTGRFALPRKVFIAGVSALTIASYLVNAVVPLNAFNTAVSVVNQPAIVYTIDRAVNSAIDTISVPGIGNVDVTSALGAATLPVAPALPEVNPVSGAFRSVTDAAKLIATNTSTIIPQGLLPTQPTKNIKLEAAYADATTGINLSLPENLTPKSDLMTTFLTNKVNDYNLHHPFEPGQEISPQMRQEFADYIRGELASSPYSDILRINTAYGSKVVNVDTALDVITQQYGFHFTTINPPVDEMQRVQCVGWVSLVQSTRPDLKLANIQGLSLSDASSVYWYANNPDQKIGGGHFNQGLYGTDMKQYVGKHPGDKFAFYISGETVAWHYNNLHDIPKGSIYVYGNHMGAVLDVYKNPEGNYYYLITESNSPAGPLDGTPRTFLVDEKGFLDIVGINNTIFLLPKSRMNEAANPLPLPPELQNVVVDQIYSTNSNPVSASELDSTVAVPIANPIVSESDETKISNAALSKMQTCNQGYGGFYNACIGEYYKGRLLQQNDVPTNFGSAPNSETDLYWCTSLIKDAANSIGINIEGNFGANQMYENFVSRNSVILAENAIFSIDKLNIKPGMVAFVMKETQPGFIGHVGIVSDIKIVDSTSVYVTIVQANAGTIEATYKLDDKGHLTNIVNGHTYYIRAFGDILKYGNSQ